MSGEPELTNVTSGPSRAAALDALPDRAARNPFYRYLMHLGLPVTFSVIVHVGILLFLGMKTFAVTTRAPVEVGEYEASLTESMAEKMKDAFQWADAEVLPAPDDMTPEPSFDSLTSLRDVPDFDARDLAAGAGATGVGDGSGLGIGDGALTLLGTGSGAGEAGTGGLGSGLGGGGARIGQAGIWDLNIHANKIVYVVDFSGSIVTVVDSLKRELKRSIGRLKPSQSFTVIIFYTAGGGVDESVRTESFKPKLEPAVDSTRREFFEWIDKRAPRGKTEPLEAMKRALSLGPEAVFLVSDGAFDDSLVGEISRVNSEGRAKIHCLVFDDQLLGDTSGLAPKETEGSRRLQRIAEANKGKTKIVTGKDLAGR